MNRSRRAGMLVAGLAAVTLAASAAAGAPAATRRARRAWRGRAHKAEGVTDDHLLALHEGAPTATPSTSMVDGVQPAERRQDQGQRGLPGRVRRRRHQVQGVGAAEARPPTWCRSTTSAPGSWWTRSRPCRRRTSSPRTAMTCRPSSPTSPTTTSLDGKLQFDAVQHVDAPALHQHGRLQEGGPGPEQAAADPRRDHGRGQEADHQGTPTAKCSPVRLRRRDLRLAHRAADRPVGRDVLRPENGRKGLATEVQFDGDTGTKVATWWARHGQAGPRHQHRAQDRRRPGRLQERNGGDEPGVDQRAAGLPRRREGQVHRATAPFPKVDASRRRRPDHRRRQRCGSAAPATATRRSAPPGSSRSSRRPPSSRRSGTPAPDTSR